MSSMRFRFSLPALFMVFAVCFFACKKYRIFESAQYPYVPSEEKSERDSTKGRSICGPRESIGREKKIGLDVSLEEIELAKSFSDSLEGQNESECRTRIALIFAANSRREFAVYMLTQLRNPIARKLVADYIKNWAFSPIIDDVEYKKAESCLLYARNNLQEGDGSRVTISSLLFGITANELGVENAIHLYGDSFSSNEVRRSLFDFVKNFNQNFHVSDAEAWQEDKLKIISYVKKRLGDSYAGVFDQLFIKGK